ncbi:MAG: class I SAM-dependent methyltransferase [Candidatus Iainarchaeum archaeon]|uniref:Class I SAM-dependent methyltransferase n=1 Tax=Candidatus Iainarchaeum sp. TaxID=3101447 RepID=A0A7T9DIQ3_9ARCH|nr:MAG: class I SAM-dependent methyltransferase [Candidatus Diapherotrites archaeon]
MIMEAEKKHTRIDSLLASLQPLVLDVGGSAGTLHEELRKRFTPEQLISLDIEILNVRTNQVLGDGQKMPFRNEAFKSILAGETIEHIADYRAFLRECWRVLRPNGVLALSTPNKKSWFNRITHSYEHPLHVSLFTPAQLRKVLEEEGFSIQKMELFPYTMESSDGAKHKWVFPVRDFVHALMPDSLREDMVFVCRKKTQRTSS